MCELAFWSLRVDARIKSGHEGRGCFRPGVSASGRGAIIVSGGQGAGWAWAACSRADWASVQGAACMQRVSPSMAEVVVSLAVPGRARRRRSRARWLGLIGRATIKIADEDLTFQLQYTEIKGRRTTPLKRIGWPNSHEHSNKGVGPLKLRGRTTYPLQPCSRIPDLSRGY